MKLQIEDSVCSRTFTYLGLKPELWKAAAARILDNQDLHGAIFKVDLDGLERLASKQCYTRLRQVIRDPDCFADVEAIVSLVVEGSWDKLDFWSVGRERFKFAVRYVWNAVKSELELDAKILECLLMDDNGGLSVEAVCARLWLTKELSCFSRVRDALGHLCKLCLVEHAHGQFSVKYGLVET